jgi:hypothetical protein
MRFYYISIFSWLAYAAVAFVSIVLLWLVWTRLLKLNTRNPAYWILVAAILIGPWVEELWIAYNFDRLCRKDAGVFITKTVEVDGFYDDTHGWRPDKLRTSGYKFMEGRDGGTIWRHEYVGEEIRSRKIDKPTARYRYKTLNSHTPVAHQIKRFEDVVIDNLSGEVLGRYTNYYRGPFWFFVSLGAPTIPCEETQAGTRKYGALIYNAVLKPSK